MPNPVHRRRRFLAGCLFLALSGLAGTAAVRAETITLAPQGVYADIDTRLATQTIRALTEGTEQARADAVQAVIAAPQDYAPPVLYALSGVLFEAGRKDEAAFWFYAGQLRARFDANRCADLSARSAVAVLNDRYGGPINRYTFQDPEALVALVETVVAWDRDTPHNYDHRWINLSGMGATTSALGGASGEEALSLPEAQWDEIAEKTRADYLAGLMQAVEQVQ